MPPTATAVQAPATVAVVAVLLLSLPPAGRAASHSDAPLIKQDPQANITDVYAFVGTKFNNASQKVLNVVVHVRPFSDPGDGVIDDRFADDARYSIHITNPATGAEITRYDFAFSDSSPVTSPGLKNPNTILSYGLGTSAGPIISVGGPTRSFARLRNLPGSGVAGSRRGARQGPRGAGARGNRTAGRRHPDSRRLAGGRGNRPLGRQAGPQPAGVRRMGGPWRCVDATIARHPEPG